MLKRIKDFFDKSDKIDLTLKSKLRFDNIHSHEPFNSLWEIYERLIHQDQTLTNTYILGQYSVFSKKIQTNTFAAAELELVSISTLCYFRPELTDKLIQHGLLAITYSLGDSIDFDDVINFVRYRILAENAVPYGGLPQKEGIKWLNEILPASRDSIEPILLDVIAKNKEELDSM